MKGRSWNEVHLDDRAIRVAVRARLDCGVTSTMNVYSQLLKEYYDNCYFEEREWLLEMDGRTTPHEEIFRNWQGDVIAVRRPW